MMDRFLHFIFFTIFTLFSSTNLVAQEVNEPAVWTYHSKKLSANEFVLTFNLKLDKGFHIWALQPGGDGFQIVPSFNYEKQSKVALIGDISEQGKLTTENMEGVEGAVSFYSDQVIYTQKVKAATGTIIKGSHEYQICSDVMCFPPTTKEFKFILE